MFNFYRINILIILFLYFFQTTCNWDNSPKLNFIIPNLPASNSNNSIDPCLNRSPSNPNSLIVTTTNSPSSITMQWVNPTDCPIGGVIIRRKMESSPTDSKDGTPISANSDNSGFTDNSVSSSMLYYYKIFLYDKTGSFYSSGLSAVAIAGSTTVIPQKVENNTITLDGLDTESAWTNSPKISFSYPVLSEYLDYTGGFDLTVSGYIRFAYDSNNFYIFYHTDDKFLRVDNSGIPWIDDSIELFFDMDYSRSTSPDTNDFKFILTPSNTTDNLYQKGNGFWWDTWTPTISQAIYTNACTLNSDGDIDSGWNMEISIPFSVLGLSSINPDQIIGFTFYINDDDLSAFSGTQHMFRWTSGTVHDQPNTWGILKF